MKTLSIHGWNVGFQKVEFTKMLQRELDYMLTDAKTATDDVLKKRQVELLLEEGQYARVSKLATQLGALVFAQSAKGATHNSLGRRPR